MYPDTRESGRRLRACGLVLLLALPLCACAISVQDSGLTERVRSRWLPADKAHPKTLYTVTDEQVVYWAVMDPSLRTDYVTFRVEWIDPHGKVFTRKKVHLFWSINSSVVAKLPIRDNYPSRMPGDWKVRLYRGDSVLAGLLAGMCFCSLASWL